MLSCNIRNVTFFICRVIKIPAGVDLTSYFFSISDNAWGISIKKEPELIKSRQGFSR